MTHDQNQRPAGARVSCGRICAPYAALGKPKYSMTVLIPKSASEEAKARLENAKKNNR